MIPAEDLHGLEEQEQGKRVFDRLCYELATAIGKCLEDKCHSAAQILMYSTIDVMASLDRPAGKPQVDRTDFRNWVKAYLLVGEGASLPCDEYDIYAARWAIVHSLHIESRDSREGNARMIFLVYKPAPLEPFQRRLDGGTMNGQRGVAVYFDELIASFGYAVDRFRALVESDPVKASLVYKRCLSVPVFWPTPPFQPRDDNTADQPGA